MNPRESLANNEAIEQCRRHMTTFEEKELIRKSIEERIKNISEEDRITESHTICKKLLNLIPKGSVVCAYAALPTEVSLTELIKELITRGDQVFLPRYSNDSITFHNIQNLDELEEGAFSVLEPPASFKVANPSAIDVVLVPGRAFDTQGNRLGRGKGGYDKWIEGQRKINPKTKMLGIAFDCQMVDEVPTEEHDQRMDDVITAH
ncbi:5-formyltetrahydrofolate cyclo-ligase [Patescibacteria group bacterium]|nr:5-formyltetrahydrofolate cyclo-ligase [Patescibacteria group bacterium]